MVDQAAAGSQVCLLPIARCLVSSREHSCSLEQVPHSLMRGLLLLLLFWQASVSLMQPSIALYTAIDCSALVL